MLNLNLNQSADRRKCVFLAGVVLFLLGGLARYMSTWIMAGYPWTPADTLEMGGIWRNDMAYWMFREFSQLVMYLGGAAMFIATWHWVNARDAQ